MAGEHSTLGALQWVAVVVELLQASLMSSWRLNGGLRRLHPARRRQGLGTLIWGLPRAPQQMAKSFCY